jgi:hypothetical protein
VSEKLWTVPKLVFCLVSRKLRSASETPHRLRRRVTDDDAAARRRSTLPAHTTTPVDVLSKEKNPSPQKYQAREKFRELLAEF